MANGTSPPTPLDVATGPDQGGPSAFPPPIPKKKKKKDADDTSPAALPTDDWDEWLRNHPDDRLSLTAQAPPPPAPPARPGADLTPGDIAGGRQAAAGDPSRIIQVLQQQTPPPLPPPLNRSLMPTPADMRMPPAPRGLPRWKLMSPQQLQSTDTGPATKIVMGIESGNRNIRQYIPGRGNVGPASGLIQIEDGTWRDFAPRMGVDLGQNPTAESAKPQVQFAVGSIIPLKRWARTAREAVLRAYPWANENMTLGQIDALARRAPQQRYILTTEARPHTEWGRRPVIPEGEVGPGILPTRYDMPVIMDRARRMQPWLSQNVGFSNMLMVQAYSGYQTSMQNGQYLNGMINQQNWKQNVTDSRDKLEVEAMDMSSAFAAYGPKEEWGGFDEEQFTAVMNQIANKYNDGILRSIADNPEAVERLMQARDKFFVDLNKTAAADERQQLAERREDRQQEKEDRLQKQQSEEQEFWKQFYGGGAPSTVGPAQGGVPAEGQQPGPQPGPATPGQQPPPTQQAGPSVQRPGAPTPPGATPPPQTAETPPGAPDQTETPPAAGGGLPTLPAPAGSSETDQPGATVAPGTTPPPMLAPGQATPTRAAAEPPAPAARAAPPAGRAAAPPAGVPGAPAPQTAAAGTTPIGAASSQIAAAAPMPSDIVDPTLAQTEAERTAQGPIATTTDTRWTTAPPDFRPAAPGATEPPKPTVDAQNAPGLATDAAPALPANLYGLTPAEIQMRAKEVLDTGKPENEFHGSGRAAMAAAMQSRAVNQYAAQINEYLNGLLRGYSNYQPQQFLQLLSQYDPTLASTVRMIGEGRMRIPSSFALRSPYWSHIIGIASRVFPNLRGQDYEVIQRTMERYRGGQEGQQVMGVNTALAHIDQLYRLVDNLGNLQLPALNWLRNAVRLQGGDPNVTNVNLVRDFVMNEVERAMRGTGGAQSQINKLETYAGGNLSPDQLKGALDNLVIMLAGKMDTLAWNYQLGTKIPTKPEDILMPEAKAVYDRISPPVPAGRADMTEGTTVKNKAGNMFVVHNGRLLPMAPPQSPVF